MRFLKAVSLAQYSSYKIGGPAKFFCAPKTVASLTKAVEEARKEKLSIFVLGGGTNLLIGDKGFDGLVIKPNLTAIQATREGFDVEAGVTIADLLDFTVKKSFAGLEWAGGLPGTLGGAVRGNAGAFGGEIKDSIKKVISLDISASEPKLIERDNEGCKFGYRTSVFKARDGDEIIISAVLNLRKGDKKAIQAAIDEKIAYRNNKQPLDYPNVGSIFKNVDASRLPKNVFAKFSHKIKNDPFPVLPSAVLIDAAGLKGVSYGGAMISPKHPNFIVNVLDARAEEIKELARLVKTTIRERFGVDLEEEVQLL